MGMRVEHKREVTIGYYYGFRFDATEHKVVGQFMACRIVDAEHNTVVEEVFDINLMPYHSVARFIVRFTIEEDRIVVKEDGGAFSGEGKFRWQTKDWNSIDLAITLSDGTKVEVKDRFDGKNLWAEKTVYAPDGKLQIKYIEEGHLIEQEDFLRKKNIL